MAAVFIARDRFVVLDKSRQLLTKSFQNEIVKKTTPPLVGIENLFFAGVTGRVILKAEDRLLLFDLQARKVISELQIPRVKYIEWNSDYSMVALISKHQIVLANKSLEQLSSVSETVRIKGGSWEENKPIFVYTTSNHIKYLLPNTGDKVVKYNT